MVSKEDRRIAEIYRRSEIILEKRKKRKKYTLLVTIPVFLCVVAIAVSLFHFRHLEEKKDAVIMGNNQEVVATEPMASPSDAKTQYLSARICSPETELCLDASEDLIRLQNALGEITASPYEVDSDDPFSLGVSTVSKFHYDPNTDYLIVLTDKEGGITEYVLRERILFNNMTKEIYTLNDDEIAALSEILQIPIK